MAMIGPILRGAAAGAAGTTALNAVTFLDMAVRGRAESETPKKTVEALADRVHVSVPGRGEELENRIASLGSLSGTATGVAVGVAYGLARHLGVRPPLWAGALMATAAALAGSNGPMTALGITDPRTWSTTDWASDIVPHVAYGLVTAATYGADD